MREKCAAIVVTYNGKKEWYDKCFQSLLSSSVPLEIIVVDNKSTDDTVAYITNKFPQVRLIQNNENFGFAGANNIGFNAALNNDNDCFFLLNQDAWVERHTVETLMLIAEKNKDFGILSPIHLTADKKSFDRGFRHSFNICSDTISAYENLYLNKQPHLYETREVAAAAWLITKKCIETVGGFDTILFKHYGEDNNYCHRVRFHRLKIGIVPSVTMCHDREYRAEKPFDIKIICAIVWGDILMKKGMYLRRFFVILMKIILMKRGKGGIQELVFVAKNRRKIVKSRKTNKIKGGGLEHIKITEKSKDRRIKNEII